MELLNKIGASRFAFALVLITATLCPGFLVLHLFIPEVITAYNPLLIVVFAIAITAPVLIASGVFIGASSEVDDIDTELLLGFTMIDGAMINILLFYPDILVAYILDFSFKGFLVMVAISFPLTVYGFGQIKK